MVIVESPVFTRQLQELLTDDRKGLKDDLMVAEKRALRELNRDW
jgi:hypothetical protein